MGSAGISLVLFVYRPVFFVCQAHGIAHRWRLRFERVARQEAREIGLLEKEEDLMRTCSLGKTLCQAGSDTSHLLGSPMFKAAEIGIGTQQNGWVYFGILVGKAGKKVPSKHKHGHRHRHTDAQTHRRTDAYTYTYTHTHTPTKSAKHVACMAFGGTFFGDFTGFTAGRSRPSYLLDKIPRTTPLIHWLASLCYAFGLKHQLLGRSSASFLLGAVSKGKYSEPKESNA